jgi:hypothetical protein
MAALTIGTLSLMLQENFVATLQSWGKISEYWGTNNISSNVRPSLIFMLTIKNYNDFSGFVKARKRWTSRYFPQHLQSSLRMCARADRFNHCRGDGRFTGKEKDHELMYE